MSRTRLALVVSLVFMSSMILASPEAAQDGVNVDMAVTGAQLKAAIANPEGGNISPNPTRLRYIGNGKFLLVDSTVTNEEEVFLVDISGDAPQFQRLVGDVELRAKVGAVRGDEGPEIMTIRDLDMDSQGNVIIATDGGKETAFLFAVSPEGNISLLSGLDGEPSSIEGLTAMAVKETTAFIVLRDRFGAPTGDSIVTIDTTVPDGGASAAAVLTEDFQFFDIIPGDIAFSPVAQIRPSNGNLVILNSGAAGVSDDVMEIDAQTGEPSILVAAADIRADIGTFEVGFNQMALAADDTIYLANTFGDRNDPATNRAIVKVSNPGGGVGDASVLASEAEIIGSPNVVDPDGNPIGRLFFPSGDGMAVTASGAVLFTERNSGGVVRVAPQP